jgi:hypothetical protein
MGVFDLYTPSRSLPRGYEITLIEGDYFLELPHRVTPRPGDPRLLKINRLGWNDRYIVVARGHWAAPPRWTVIDVASDIISEPMNEGDWVAMRQADSSLAGVTVYDIDEAWRRLE